ncbi:hypothetical protein [Tenacibaculum maritimum]|uniref:hypothetical protein n=2 Tax=Tenacibaculum maritimum TaxID=107401 RepID=UPI0038770BFC
MILAMNARITFTKQNSRQFTIKKVNSVVIESSWRMLTDIAEIILPRNIADFDNQKIKEVFEIGDKVLIELGYNGNLIKEFEGYITEVSAEIPVRISCQDEMWKLKQLPVNLSLKSTSLQNLLKAIAPMYNIVSIDIDIAAQRFPKTTAAKVLEKLKQNYSLYSYMIDGVLYCNLKSDRENLPIPIHLEKEVVQNNLIYKTTDERKVKIRIISILKNGNKVEEIQGDEDGEEIQKTYYGISNKKTLKKIALAEYIRHKVNGFEGTIESFGTHIIHHGDAVFFKSDQYGERTGTNLVETVRVEFNDSPKYHRILTLDESI